ncbi:MULTISPECIES: PIG-L deacetylase family protein [Paenibacillus]|uniref:PIG-L deacetylase family protein n=1 Tax=Paenibacillus TaxID=44249 RepID=UPI002FDF1E0A
MKNSRTIAFIYAHPDDETFTSSYLIRKSAREGHLPVLLTATRGDAGKTGRLGSMTPRELAARRERELEQAARILGIAEVRQLGMGDGKLKDVPAEELQKHIEEFIVRHNAEVVVTFPEDGISGHRDHIVIHHAVNAVIFSGRTPSVQKLYYNQLGSYQSESSSVVKVEAGSLWEAKRLALQAHESQILSIERVFGELGPEVPPHHRFEAFELAWERGVHFPHKSEQTIWDNLL